MAKPEPTKFELDVLRVLWVKPGGATVRDVHDEIRRSRAVSFTAVGTTMRRMVDKGLARVTDGRKPQKFEATQTQEQLYGSILTDVRRRIFGGSVAKLIRHALGASRPTRAEVDEVKRMIDEHERDKGR